MIRILNRLVNRTGKYSLSIRLSYLTSFIKGILMKIPMMLCFLTIASFMEGTMDRSKCLKIGIAMVISVLLEAVFEHLTNILESAAGYKVFADMRMELGDHLRKLPMGFFTEGNLGKISSVLATDMVFIEENCMAVLGELVSFMISQFIMIVMMSYLDIRLGIITVIICSVMILIGNLMLKNTLDHSEIKQECAKKLSDAVLDFAEGIGIIKSYNMLGEKSRSLSDEFTKSCDESIAFELDYSPWCRSMWMTYGIGTSVVLGYAAYLTATGSISKTYMMGVVLFIFDLFASLKSYYGQIARLTVTAACLNRIDKVFEEAELADTGKEQVPSRVTDSNIPEIEFKNVTFGYTDKDVLKGISFVVDSGQMAALVGPSGGGKSTIASLFARFWDIESGSILLRGKNIKDVPLGELMNNISIVFQRVYLFQDTIYNNIVMGRPDATKEEVINAAKRARCYDFIMQLPQGFDTMIGEGGASLSGGEKQRISIARCILKDSPIVILDEATASIDADNERAIQEAISELCKDKTLLVIAHRLKTIRDADKIFVISDGRIIENGTHDELIKKNGIYAHMVSLQTA